MIYNCQMPVYRVRWIARGDRTQPRNTYLAATDPNEAIGGALDVHNPTEGDFEIQSVTDVSDYRPQLDPDEDE